MMKKLLFTLTLLTASHAVQAAGTGPVGPNPAPQNQMDQTITTSMSGSEQILEALPFILMFLPTDQAGIEKMNAQLAPQVQAGLTTLDVALSTMNRFLHQDTKFSLTADQKIIVQGLIDVITTIKGFIPQTTLLVNQMMALAPQKEGVRLLFEKNQELLRTTLLEEYKKAVERTTEQEVRTVLQKAITFIEQAKPQQSPVEIADLPEVAAEGSAVVEQPKTILRSFDPEADTEKPVVSAPKATLLNAQPDKVEGAVEPEPLTVKNFTFKENATT